MSRFWRLGSFYTDGEFNLKSILLPDEVYERAAELAAIEDISVDRLVAALVSERVGERLRLQKRAARGSWKSSSGFWPT